MRITGYFSRVRFFLMMVAAIGAGLQGTARGDTLVLSDGRYLHGEVIEQTATYVVFRHRVASIWVSQKFSRAEVDLIDEQPGDQSDLGEAQPQSSNSNPTAAPGESRPALPQVAVIPLHGAVGGLGEESLRDTFDAAGLEQYLVEAEKAGVIAVILDIQSPGGLVSEMEAICQTIIRWHSRLRIIAYPRDAFSAAAIISLCCKEMVVRPDSRIGAAVLVRQGPGGISAVEAKMASPHYARQRQFMAASGRPYEVVAAMTIPETRLWWSPSGAFRTDPPADNSQSWQEVDSQTTVLTMTGDQAVEWSLASGFAQSVTGVPRQVGLTQQVDIIDMSESIDRYNKALDRKFQELCKQLTNYFTAMGGLVNLLNNLRAAYERKDRDAAGRLKGDIAQHVSKINVVGRAIQRIDKSVLARRVELPDSVIRQIQEDAQLLGKINRLLKTDTYEGYNETVDRVNAVLESWRTLLGIKKDS